MSLQLLLPFKPFLAIWARMFIRVRMRFDLCSRRILGRDGRDYLWRDVDLAGVSLYRESLCRC